MHLLLHMRIYPLTYLSWLNIVAQLSLSHLAIQPWANIIARLRSRSTLGQTLLQDFVRDLLLGKYHCKTLLATYSLANLIAGFHSQFTLGQTSLQDSARNLPLVNLTCPWLIHNLPVYPCTLSFFRLCWVSPSPPQPSSCYWVESITRNNFSTLDFLDTG